jgi:hypothetical protein
MRPEDLKPEMLEICVARGCFDHKPYFTPQQVADALQAIKQEALNYQEWAMDDFKNDYDTNRFYAWLAKISELRSLG